MSTVRDTGADVVAAGAVLWRPTSDGSTTEIAVVHRPRYDDWSLPKGKVSHGESTPAAAVRELAEETGFVALLGARLGESRYRVPEGDKIVHYWCARVGDGQFQRNDEVDELRWVSPDGAPELLSYQRDLELVDRFRALSPPPRPVLLTRHAKAGDRESWHEEDDLRPLTSKGHLQAKHLAELFELFGPATVYSAPPVRCVQTVEPFAQRHGLSVEPEPRLGEHGYWQDPDAGLARFLELAGGPEIALVCSQGGVIPDLVQRLTGESEPPSRKASTWVLGFADGRVVSADYYPEPAA